MEKPGNLLRVEFPSNVIPDFRCSRNLKMRIIPTYPNLKGCIIRFLNLPSRLADHENFSCSTEVDPCLCISCGICIPRGMYVSRGNLLSALFKSGLVKLSKGTQSPQKPLNFSNFTGAVLSFTSLDVTAEKSS